MAGGSGVVILPCLWMAASILALAVSGLVGTDLAYAFLLAYRRACATLESESWMLGQCRDPVFSAKIRAFGDVCDRVESNARVGAFWLAARDVEEAYRPQLRQGWALALLALLCSVPIFYGGALQCSVRPETLPLHDKS